MYPVIFAIPREKIHFLMSPKVSATFYPPAGKEASWMFVWVAVFKDTTFGSFQMAMYGFESEYYDADGNLIKIRDELHWYTSNLRAGEAFACLAEAEYPEWQGVPYEWTYDVARARIDIATSEHELNATVIVKGETLFTVKYRADSVASIESRIEPGSPLPQELFLSVEAYRPILTATVTGLETGDFISGRFTYIDTELVDPSLLP